MEFPVDTILRSSHPSRAARFPDSLSKGRGTEDRLALRLFGTSPTMAALERLCGTGDDVLQAQGMTRRGEIARILGPRGLL